MLHRHQSTNLTSELSYKKANIFVVLRRRPEDTERLSYKASN